MCEVGLQMDQSPCQPSLSRSLMKVKRHFEKELNECYKRKEEYKVKEKEEIKFEYSLIQLYLDIKSNLLENSMKNYFGDFHQRKRKELKC